MVMPDSGAEPDVRRTHRLETDGYAAVQAAPLGGMKS